MELLSSHTYLATYLLEEKHQGNDSFWKPFIDILPTSYRNMPIFFDDEEKSYLTGSFSLKKMAERIESLTTEYNNLCSRFPDFKKFTYDEFVWARMVVITRIFGFYIKERKTDGLVAMADMLNHKFPQDKDVKWAFDDESNGFIMTSIKTIQPGNQVFDSYGRKCNHRFFVNYGFSLEENEDNEVILRVQVKRDDPLYSTKISLLHSAGHGSVKEFQIPASTKHEKSRELFSYVRIANSSGTELMVIPTGDDLKLETLPPLGIETEKQVLKDIKKAASDCLARFPTTLEMDNHILASEKLTFNIRNAILMRRGEKQVCHYYIELCDQMLPLLDLDWKDLKKIASKCQNGTGKFDAYVIGVIVPLVKAGN